MSLGIIIGEELITACLFTVQGITYQAYISGVTVSVMSNFGCKTTFR